RAAGVFSAYRLKEIGMTLLDGAAIGEAFATGDVCRIASADNIADFKQGAILVTEMTDPDWVPIMKKAAAIITDHGGRTSHAAIVSRELGLPAIVGTGRAMTTLADGQTVTVSCAEGETGFVYEGAVDFESRELDLSRAPKTRTKIMLNLANPAAAFRWWRLPSDGVGLARLEFIIGNTIKIHPMALARFDKVGDDEARRQIEILTTGFADKRDYFVELLAEGVARIAAAQYPNPVIVRLSDFKTNEYANLIGGRGFEPKEDNPMLGWRGASRYYHDDYRAGFALECQAMKRARQTIGLDNVKLMIPFCRTLQEADKVLAELAANGLKRGERGLEIYIMAEIPSNVILAEKFAKRFDGFSIGSNDLTQLALGVDRDSDLLKTLFDERNEAVKALIVSLIERARALGAPVGICGQAPSDHPDFAQFLVEHRIDSISVSPDSFLAVKEAVAAIEARRQA
ncbi:MAG: phosphoenolpyruvate synthase, partial [Amphiplicatus sp.]